MQLSLTGSSPARVCARLWRYWCPKPLRPHDRSELDGSATATLQAARVNMPEPAATALVLVMATAIGFATQRGNVCSVLAARQIAELGETSRLRSFVLASLWAMTVVTALAWATGRVAPAHTFTLDGLTVLGAAGYGAGTMLNGACIFGTAARVLSGNLSFLATLAGIAIGGALGTILELRRLRSPIDASPLAEPTLAGAALIMTAACICVAAVWQFWSAQRRAGKRPGQWFAAARWETAVALPVIGVLGGLLLASNQPWNYPVLLRSLGALAAGVPFDVSAITVLGPLAFTIGGIAAARLGGRAAWQRPELLQVLRSLAGGTLMGLAGFLIPGGNDALLLSGLPSLSLHALAAYIIMLAVQIGLALAQKAQQDRW